MKGATNKDLIESALSRHYAAQRARKREAIDPAVIDSLARAMLAEDARLRRARGRRLSLPAFVAAQVRYIPAWTWAAQVAIAALMCVMAQMAGDANMTKFAIGVLSAATVLVGVPTVQASKLHGVAELEYSCPHNAASVLAARLIVLGCSSSLAVAVMVGATASAIDASAFQVALWACPPFLCSCAGSLVLLRRVAPQVAGVMCVAWVGACSAVLLTAGHMLPDLYAQASLGIWMVAVVVALAWLVREVALTCRAATAGLDAFSPHDARTYN